MDRRELGLISIILIGLGLILIIIGMAVSESEHPPTVVIKTCEQKVESFAVYPGDMTRMPDKKVDHD